MLVLDGKTDLNQISLTGVRALTLIGLLAVAPRSLAEIREKFLEYKIMEPSHSDDILRIDLNTIKAVGCEVTRSSPKTDFKYVLTKNPFTIPVTYEDIDLLQKVFDKIKNENDISVLLDYHHLLKKIASYIYEDDIKEAFLGISPLIRFNTDLLSELILDCKDEKTLELIYQKQTAANPSQKTVIAKKLVLKNDKVYFYCYDLKKMVSIMLLFKNIKKIISRKLTREGVEVHTTDLIFSLKGFDEKLLTEDEKIIDKNGGEYLVKGRYFNEFLAIQRILSFGSKCTVKEPVEMKDKIIKNLKEMRSIYEEKES